MSAFANSVSNTQAARRATYGRNYVLTMHTIHKKSTLSTSVGKEPMMKFLRENVPDLENSEYKDLLSRNPDRAEAVIRVQTKYWKDRGENNRASIGGGTKTGLSQGKTTRLGRVAGEVDPGIMLNLPPLDDEAKKTKPGSKKRKTRAQREQEELDAERERHEEALALQFREEMEKRRAELEKELQEERARRAQEELDAVRRLIPIPPPFPEAEPGPEPYFPSARYPKRPGPPEPLYPPHPPAKKRHVMIGREPECVANTRQILDVLVRNARADWNPHPVSSSRGGSVESLGADDYFSEYETDVYGDDDSAVLLRFRTHPLSLSRATKTLVDGIVRRERVMRGGYRGKGVAKIAARYMEMKEGLMELVVGTVDWDEGMKKEDEAKLLVESVLKY